MTLMVLWVGLLTGHALGLYQAPLLPQTERWLYDLRMRGLAPAQAESDIVVVDIDERALAAHGRWPWPRGLLAELLTQVADTGGARLVGLDLIFAEPDLSVGTGALQKLAQRQPDNAALQAAIALVAPQLTDDRKLEQALRRLPVVLGLHLSNEAGAAQVGTLPEPLASLPAIGSAAKNLRTWRAYTGNLASVQDAASLGAGHLNALVDSDGQVRQLPLLVPIEGGLHGTLAVAMARALMSSRADPATGAPARLAAVSFEPAEGPLQAVHLRAPATATPAVAGNAASAAWAWPAHLRLPIDAQAHAWVPYASQSSGFVRWSAADVLAHRLPADALRDKLVLVGVSAPGLVDQRPTPVDEAMLGTLVHAHMLSAMLQQRMLATPPAAPLIEAVALLALALCLWRGLPRRPLWQGALLTAGLLLLVVAAEATAWVWGGWVMPMASLLLLPVSLLLAHGLLAYRHATGNRRQLATLFGQYVPPELVDRMSLEPGRYTMRSRSTELTVLFADVHGFSGLAEHMPPAELGAMMNMIFSHLTDVVREHRGTLDKYIGDSVMAFWGAPLDDPDHAERAVAAALAMRERLPTLHAEMATHGWPPLDINIGVNTGTMVVGDMGSRHRRAYTVMGDAVNMAARVQALCSQFGLGLVIGDATQQSLSGVLCLALGHIKVRGRDAPIQVWHPLPFRAGESRQADVFCREWARMRLAVEGGRFAEALGLLDALQTNLSLQPLCRWQRRQLQAGPTLDQPRG